MPRFEVTLVETRTYEFGLDAESAEDAKSKALKEFQNASLQTLTAWEVDSEVEATGAMRTDR
jgi:hypothetical protein